MNSQLVYKLTNENGQTYGGARWAPGVTHSGTGEGELCGPGFIHYYSDPLLAVLLNPIHGDFKLPRMWEAKPSGKTLSDRGLKFGSVSLTVIREIDLPVVTTEHRVRFAILCALEVYNSPEFLLWAENWLSGVDRSGAVAAAAAAAAEWAARGAVAAEWAARGAVAAKEAAEAAEAAEWAALEAAVAAEAEWAARGAVAAKDAAEAAVAAKDAAEAAVAAAVAEAAAAKDAAEAAAWAAKDAARWAARGAAASSKSLDLVALAKKALA